MTMQTVALVCLDSDLSARVQADVRYEGTVNNTEQSKVTFAGHVMDGYWHGDGRAPTTVSLDANHPIALSMLDWHRSRKASAYAGTLADWLALSDSTRDDLTWEAGQREAYADAVRERAVNPAITAERWLIDRRREARPQSVAWDAASQEWTVTR